MHPWAACNASVARLQGASIVQAVNSSTSRFERVLKALLDLANDASASRASVEVYGFRVTSWRSRDSGAQGHGG